MDTTNAFNLHTLVLNVLESSTSPDPGDVAHEVARRTPVDEIPAAYAKLLRGYVREVIASRRTLSVPAQDIHDEQSDLAASVARHPAKGSKRVAALKEAWRKVLAERIHVGPAPTDWKFLADCTRDDLVFAANERRQQAAANLAKAAQLDLLGTLLSEHNVSTVSELSDPVLRKSLQAAA